MLDLKFRTRTLTVAVIAVSVLALAALVSSIVPVLLVGFAAFLYANALVGVARLLAKIPYVSEKLGVAIVLVAIVVAIIGVVTLLGPRVSIEMDRLVELLPAAFDRITESLSTSSWGRLFLEQAPSTNEMQDHAKGVLSHVTGVFSTTLSSLANVAIIIVVGIYLAIDLGRYKHLVLRLFPHNRKQGAEEIITIMGVALRRWLVGRLISMAVVGALTMLGLWLLGVPLPIALGLIAGLLSFVPNLGPIMSLAPAMLLASLEGTALIGWVIGLFITIQIVESYLITPLIEEQAVSLPAPGLILGQLAFGILFGISGLILATPLLIVFVILVQKLYIEGYLGKEIVVLGETSDSDETGKEEGKGTE